MQHITTSVTILGGKRATTFVLEQFDSIAEAIEHLGEAQVLALLNYAHSLHERASIHRQLWADEEASRPKGGR